MRERIDLTDDERDAVFRALSPILTAVALWRNQPDYALGPAVDAVINTVNKARAEDPLGTVRRNPTTGEVAIRAVLPCNLMDCQGKPPEPSWHWIDEQGTQRHARRDDSISGRDIRGRWRVIYSPRAGRKIDVSLSLAEDLRRLTESNTPYDDQARDLLGSYDIRPKP